MHVFTLLTSFERKLWGISMVIVVVSSLASGVSALHLITSLIGVTALIFVAKGHVLGQILTIVFGCLYGLISYQYAYYGEMITYLGMTVPMAAMATVSWLRHPYQGDKRQVQVASFSWQKGVSLLLATVAVTTLFYFILAYFQTQNLALSTLSVATSFSAVFLTYLRSPYYALAYALNDLVLIGLWLLATMTYLPYLTMVVCFVMFFLNDLYGFYNWRKMAVKQGLQTPS